jgi:hypothetical protein
MVERRRSRVLPLGLLLAYAVVDQGGPRLVEAACAPPRPLLPRRPPARAPALPRPEPAIDALAGMICNECLVCSPAERLAVGQVALTRASRPGWWGRNLAEVLAAPGQFAAPHPDCATLPDQTRETLRCEARLLLEGRYQGPARGAVFFHARRLAPSPWPDLAAGEAEVPPEWYHRFYRLEPRR